jgi:hypothetical protein
VGDLRRDPDSLLNWIERLIRMRQECRELSWGDYKLLATDRPHVLAMQYLWRGSAMVTLHNFSSRECDVVFTVEVAGAEVLADVFARRETRAERDRTHRLMLEAYGDRWLRVGAVDNACAWTTWRASRTGRAKVEVPCAYGAECMPCPWCPDDRGRAPRVLSYTSSTSSTGAWSL